MVHSNLGQMSDSVNKSVFGLRPGIGSALLAAALFGASTPLAKILLADVSPVMLAGLLYAGSGLGLTLWWVLGHRHTAAGEASLQRKDIPSSGQADARRTTRS